MITISYKQCSVNFDILARDSAIVLYEDRFSRAEEYYLALLKLTKEYQNIDSEFIMQNKGDTFFTFDLYIENNLYYLVAHHQEYIERNIDVLKYYCKKYGYKLITYYFEKDLDYMYYEVI